MELSRRTLLNCETKVKSNLPFKSRLQLVTCKKTNLFPKLVHIQQSNLGINYVTVVLTQKQLSLNGEASNLDN